MLSASTIRIPQNRIETTKDAISLIADFAVDYQSRFGEGSAQPQAGVVITAIRVRTAVDNEKIDFSALAPDQSISPIAPQAVS